MRLGQIYLRLLTTRWFANVQCAIARALDSRGSEVEYDVIFVTPPATTPAWILDGICREVAARLAGLRVKLHPVGVPLPAAKAYFFSHFMFFIDSLRTLSAVHRARSYVFATHLEAEKYGVADALVAQLLARAQGVLCMNEALRSELTRLGTPPDRLKVLVGACDARVFQAHRRTADGKVGFCSAFYQRKSPHLVLEIVRALPHRKFLLLGKGWEKFADFPALRAQPNFEYAEASYRDYPAYYAQMSVFVSVSQKEGGPIPLLEAMMSNVVPVASHTGFAPDVIEHGKNGFLFPVNSDASAVAQLIDRAFTLETDVRATVSYCDWDPYTARLAREMGLPPNATSRTSS